MDDVFLELFAGAGGLTAAVRRAGRQVKEAQDLRDVRHAGQLRTEFDLLSNSHFSDLKKLVRSGRVRWLHGGPPCKTFTKARRRDRHGSARVLRSAAEPLGFKSQAGHRLPRRVEEANELARRMAKLAKIQHKAGGWFTIENPERSFIWEIPAFVDLAALPGVARRSGDQCALGGVYTKPTSWLTNAEWMQIVEQRCPPEHPRHQPLEGRVIGPDGVEVWLTELAAEYPEGLCDALAAAYSKAVESAPLRTAPFSVRVTAEGKVDAAAAETGRQRRRREEEECVGGLRNPLEANSKVPGWSTTGEELRNILDRFVEEHRVVLAPLAASLGTPEAGPMAPALVDELRLRLAQWLQVPDGRQEEKGLQSWLVEALTAKAADPDTEVPRWLASATPLGIVKEIVPCGIFPRVQPPEGAAEAARLDALAAPAAEADGNYKSYEENQALADAEFAKECTAGYVQWHRSRTHLERSVGRLVQSRIGVIVKEKEDGSTKVRLVHDLKRSGVNAQIIIKERIVLPRLFDVINAILDLMGTLEPAQALGASPQVELVCMDFKDAFKMLRSAEEEQRFLAGRACDGWFYYERVLFGVRSGPLVWGRVAAWVGRCTQAVMKPSEGRLSIFVDDPLLAVAGDEGKRELIILRVLCLWSALGLQAAWDKAQRGKRVQWIGAELTARGSCKGVRTTLPESKRLGLISLMDEIQQAPGGQAQRALVRTLAGRGSWVGGLLPQVRTFIRQVWAALTSSTAASKSGRVFVRQMAPALAWLRAFAEQSEGAFMRDVYLIDRSAPGAVIEVDASPWGGGAVWWPETAWQAGEPPHAYLQVAWTAEDCALLHAVVGDPGSQAIWEAFMFLLAVRQWLNLATRGRLTVRCDAEGVLLDLVQMRAKSAAINEIAKELALLLAPMGRELVGIHLWSENNELADALSRGAPPTELAAVLGSARQDVPGHRGQAAWKVLRVAPPLSAGGAQARGGADPPARLTGAPVWEH